MQTLRVVAFGDVAASVPLVDDEFRAQFITEHMLGIAVLEVSHEPGTNRYEMRIPEGHLRPGTLDLAVEGLGRIRVILEG